MHKISLVALCISLSCLSPTITLADENVDNAMSQDGFSDIDRLYQSMTPEQKADVLKAANAKMQELQKMSPEEQQRLFDQLKAINGTIAVDKVNPQALDTTKTLSLDQTTQSLDTYQKRYSEGKIHNDVVNPPPSE